MGDETLARHPRSLTGAQPQGDAFCISGVTLIRIDLDNGATAHDGTIVGIVTFGVIRVDRMCSVGAHTSGLGEHAVSCVEVTAKSCSSAFEDARKERACGARSGFRTDLLVVESDENEDIALFRHSLRGQALQSGQSRMDRREIVLLASGEELASVAEGPRPLLRYEDKIVGHDVLGLHSRILRDFFHEIGVGIEGPDGVQVLLRIELQALGVHLTVEVDCELRDPRERSGSDEDL